MAAVADLPQSVVTSLDSVILPPAPREETPLPTLVFVVLSVAIPNMILHVLIALLFLLKSCVSLSL